MISGKIWSSLPEILRGAILKNLESSWKVVWQSSYRNVVDTQPAILKGTWGQSNNFSLK